MTYSWALCSLGMSNSPSRLSNHSAAINACPHAHKSWISDKGWTQRRLSTDDVRRVACRLKSLEHGQGKLDLLDDPEMPVTSDLFWVQVIPCLFLWRSCSVVVDLEASPSQSAHCMAAPGSMINPRRRTPRPEWKTSAVCLSSCSKRALW